MTEHLSTGIIERFQMQELMPGDKRVIYDHIVECESCRLQAIDSQMEAIGLRALTDHLLPNNLEERYHLSFEMIEGYVDNDLSSIDRDTAEMHLEVCEECSNEVEDLRESLATMRESSFPQFRSAESPAPQNRNWLLQVWTQPPRVPTLGGLTLVAIVGILIFWLGRSPSSETQLNNNV